MKRETAIVTGGAKRLGAEIAIYLANSGYDIALHFNKSQKSAEQTKSAIERTGNECRLFKADLGEPGSCEHLVHEIFDWTNNCTLLINNASVFDRGGFLETNSELLEREIAINFMAPFLITRTFVQCTRSGLIINMLDSRIKSLDTGYYAYTLSKKILYEHTLMSALELAPSFRVNGICPGPVLPPSGHGAGLPDLKRIPLQRTGTVEEILKAVGYLIQNEYVTGECLFVDGGKKLNW